MVVSTEELDEMLLQALARVRKKPKRRRMAALAQIYDHYPYQVHQLIRETSNNLDPVFRLWLLPPCRRWMEHRHSCA
jgi:hypothetical protein